MDDEELRAEFAALVAPVLRIPVPDSGGLRRRLRRRRTGQATAGALACACVVASFGLFLGRSPAPSTYPQIALAGGCANLEATWLPPAHVNGQWAEGPPKTSLLVLRNRGRTACSLDGWPRFVFSPPAHPRSVSVSYKTHFDEWVGTFLTRVVEPTRILLQPGQAAVSAVSIELPPALTNGCLTKAWLVRPPSPGAPPVRSRGQLPEICDDSSLWVSAVYPRGVPVTKDYPGSSPIRPLPASTVTLRATPRG